MEKKTGYCITTYKLRLYCEHKDWLYETRDIYNRVLGFYYGILQKEPELADLPKQKLLRKLELLTIGSRGQDKAEVKYLLPYKKIPLYFRRAAISDAIRLHRSYMTGKEQGRQPAGHFQTAPVFYKGMYRDLTERGISLKLWNGEKWVWTECCLDTCKRRLPEVDQLLSPSLKLEGKRAMLHVPVMQEVLDVRKVKERFSTEEKICAVAFPGSGCLAVLTVLDKNGICIESLFVQGGKELEHEKQKLLNRIRKNRESMGCHQGKNPGKNALLPEDENKHLKEKIRDLTDTYVHRATRQIVDFCDQRGICILVVPNYKQSMDLNTMGYLQATSYDWLGRRIIQYLRYKAFAKGIVVTSVSTGKIAGSCYVCGQPVKRYNKNNKPGKSYYGGKNYICPNGHRGNAYFNTAMNVGRRFLKSQAEMQG